MTESAYEERWQETDLISLTRHHSGNGKLIKGKLLSSPQEGAYPAFSASGQDTWRAGFEHDGDAIVVSAVGARCGKCFIARGKWSAVANTHVVWPDRKQVDLRFLWYLLNDEHWWIRSGTAQPFVAVRRSFERRMRLPPLPVQVGIVAYLDEQLSRLDASVAALHRVQANLKRYRASVLKSACEGRLVPTEAELARQENRDFETGAQLLRRILAARRARVSGRSKYKEPSTPAAIHLSDAPEGWAWSNVDQLAEVGTGATPKRDVQAFYEGGHIAWVTSGAVNGEYVDQASEFVTERALAETNLSVYPPGTLLLAMYGEGKTRGRCSELRIAATTNQALAAIQAAEPVRRYLRLLLERSYEETRKAASGGVQPNLNLSLVRAIAVPLPPLAEQHRIVAEADRRLSLIRVAEAQVAANLARAQRLRQSILQAAFRTPAQAGQ